MRCEVRDGRAVLVRDAAAGELLVRLAGPGVPEVLGREDGAVVTSYAPPLSLAMLTPGQLAGVFADVAHVLARAHAAGITHGRIDDEDVRGGVASVVIDGWRDDALQPADDIVSLARLIERHAGGDAILLAATARALAPVPLSAAALASALRPPPPAPRRHRRRQPRMLVAAGSAAAILVVLGAGSVHRAEAQPAPPVVFTADAVDHDGHRWRATSAGDVAGLVCDLPVVLHRATGDVFALDDWQTPRRVARHVTAIGARGCRLAVRDGHGRWRAAG